MPAIEVRGLERRYRSSSGLLRRTTRDVVAVQGISFEVERGELFGLLGPNGAGKTTTIKMLITLLLPSAGSASIQGFDVVADPREVRKRVGYAFGGDRGLYERLSAFDNLRYFAELYGVDPREQKARIGELLDVVGLEGRERERVEGYSRGMRQRLHLARALLHKPEVLFLDEPSIGIDPVGAHELRATVARLKAGGTTILLTTHYMYEADELCDRLAVIADGRMVAAGTPESIKARVSGRSVVEVELLEPIGGTVDQLRGLPNVDSVSIDPRDGHELLQVRGDGTDHLVPSVVEVLQGFRLGRIGSREPTLEDAYIELVTQR